MTDNNQKKHHLIVLVHGLWGSSANMARFESVIHHSLENSKTCSFHTYAPTCFAHFKTYDGIVAIGDYVLVDLFKHLKTLKNDHDIDISQISFIGYSLGGLISRYIIGELYETGFFEKVEPCMFTTMATPHLGSHFYNYTSILNVLGSHLLGQTGKDLFLVEGKNGIVYKLSDPDGKYYLGLNQFKSKMVVANAKFDRTVGFYSAFITKYDVFSDWNKIEPKFIDGLPNAVIDENGKLVECLVIDFNNTKRLPETSTVRNPESNVMRMVSLGALMMILFPMIFSVSLFATIKSYVRVRILPKPNLNKLWNSLSAVSYSEESLMYHKSSTEDSDGYDEEENLQEHAPGMSHLTRKMVENGLNMMSEDNTLERTVTNTSVCDETRENYNIDLDFTVEYKSKKNTVSNLMDCIVCNDLSSIQLTENIEPLPFDETRNAIFENLNTIDWKKVGVLQQNLNSHQSIVGRRGFNRTPESIPFLFLYTHILEDSIKEASQ